MKHGIWWDLGSGHSVKRAEKYAGRIKRAGLDHVAIMLNSSSVASDGTAVWKWSGSRLAAFCTALCERGLTVGYSVWARPQPAYMDSLKRGLADRVQPYRPHRLEADLEGKWRARYVKGFADLHEAGDALLALLRPYGLTIECTSYPLHSEYGERPTFADEVDVVCPQAYSYYKHNKRSRGWLGRYGPGAMQRLALSRVATSGKIVVCGLAAYSQTFPEHSPHEAMRTAYRAATTGRPSEIRWWSAKQLWGHKHNHYALGSIRTLIEGSQCND
jgi:hypothetical protein